MLPTSVSLNDKPPENKYFTTALRLASLSPEEKIKFLVFYSCFVLRATATKRLGGTGGHPGKRNIAAPSSYFGVKLEPKIYLLLREDPASVLTRHCPRNEDFGCPGFSELT